MPVTRVPPQLTDDPGTGWGTGGGGGQVDTATDRGYEWCDMGWRAGPWIGDRGVGV